MGSNQSHGSGAKWREQGALDGNYNVKGRNANMKSSHGNVQGKPLPPHGIPSISEVTHNSLSLSWQPPKLTNGGSIIAYMIEMYVVSERQWVILTKSCQGNFYKVRNLQPDTEYQFRVKAENIYGRSKTGSVSEIVHTSSFDVHDFSPSKESKVTVKRRHSLNIHVPVEGRVASILNHSSPVVATTTPKPDESRNALQRDGTRSSLQNMKKRSGSSLIPGTKTNSLMRLRTSQTKLQDSENRRDEIETNRNSIETSLEKLDMNTDSDSKSDIGSECNTSQSSGSEYLEREQCNQNHLHIDEGINCGEKILNAPLSDDVKLALYSRSDKYRDKNANYGSDEGIDTLRSSATPDFRTLRSMLQSSDVIIKPTQSLPEISDVCRGKPGRGSARNKLSTIVDDEDDDSVRVTTL